MTITTGRRGSLLVAAAVLTALALGGCSGDRGTSAVTDPTTGPSGSGALADGSATGEEPVGSTIVPEGGELPDGTYRVEFTDEHLAAHGLDAEGIADNHGVWTTTLGDGRWSVEQVSPDVLDSFEGVYEVRARDLYWRFHDTLQVLHLRWRVDGDRDLHFEQVTEGPADFQFALEWSRTR